MRPPTPAEETALRVLLKAEARRLLTNEDLERLGRAAINRIEARIHSKNGAPAGTGTPTEHPTAVKEPKDMNDRTHHHPMTLRVGDVITRDPYTGDPCEWTVTDPPVRHGDCAEIGWTDGTRNGWFAVPVHDRVNVRPPARADVIDGLRRLADHLEENPHAPVQTPRERALEELADRYPIAFAELRNRIDGGTR